MYLNNKGKHMNLIKTLVVLTFSVVVIGCGGGSGSDNNTVASETNVSVTESVTQEVMPTETAPIIKEETEAEIDPNAVYSSTAELVVAKSFLLEPEYDLQVNYVNTNEQNIYLSVCTDFEESNTGIEVNYESCLVRTSVTESFQEYITIPNDKTKVVMAIWDLDNPQEPRFETWEYSTEDNNEHIFTVI